MKVHNQKITMAVCSDLLNYHSKTDSEIYSKVFAEYFKARNKWKFILEELDSEFCNKKLKIFLSKDKRYEYD